MNEFLSVYQDTEDHTFSDIISNNTFDLISGAEYLIGYPYIDETGTERASPADIIELTGGTSLSMADGGWYYAEGNISYTGTVKVTGDVNLILADGCTMTVPSAGINVIADSSLTIYPQAGRTGVLISAGNTVLLNGINSTLINIATIQSTTASSSQGVVNNAAGITSSVENYGIIQGGYNGIYLKNGGTVENFGEISGTKYSIYVSTSAASTVLLNRGTLNGSVSLRDGANTVTFAAGSIIEGTFAMGTNADSTLGFIGELDPSLTYSTVTGTFTMGANRVFVSMDINGIPSGLHRGDAIVLIDAGKVSGTPENSTYSADGYDMGIFVSGNQLIATPPGDAMGGCQYVDGSGIAQISPGGTIELVSGTVLSLTDGWYYAYGDLSYTDTVKVTGNVNLILADGCTMTVPATGISVSADSSLTIYPQMGKTGVLISVGNTVLLNGSDSTLINIATITSTTSSTTQGAVNSAGGVTSLVENYGVIQGGYNGIYLKSGGTVENFGEISGTKYGIYAAGSAGTVIENAGGIIQGGTTGIYLNAAGTIDNSGTIIGTGTGTTDSGVYANTAEISINNNPGGIIRGSTNGIYLKNGGTVENFGEISGTKYSIFVSTTAASTVLANGGTLNGNTALKNGANTVTFVAGSVINGDFTMGTNADSTLAFTGTLDPSLTYSTVTGTFTMGANKVFVGLDVNGIPSGLQKGDAIVLIDAGKVSGTPENKTYGTAGYDFEILVSGNQLVASPPGEAAGGCPYVDGSGIAQVSPDSTIELVSGTVLSLTDGWYYAVGDISYTDSVKVTGNVNLILADGCTMTVPATGISVSADSTLTIYPQAGRTGVLTSAGNTVLLSGSNSTLVNIATVMSTTATTTQGAVNYATGTSSVTNYGIIQGGYNGIYLKLGGSVENFGEISGTRYGICITGAAGTVTNNTDGMIQGGVIGIYFYATGTVDNSGIITGSGTAVTDSGIYSTGAASVTNNTDGIIQGGTNGIYLKSGGSVENFGEISGSKCGLYVSSTAASTTLVNGGTFNGTVSNYGTNTITIIAGSVINGDLTIGTNAGSTLSFIGELDQSLTYSTVTGTFTMGANRVSVELDINGIPSGLQKGDAIVLVDAGKITGTLKNSIYSTAGHDFGILVSGNQLMALPPGDPAGGCQYIDENDIAQVSPENTTRLASGAVLSLTDGWYYADGDILYTDMVKVTGNVNLILADGCTMTVPATGINVSADSTFMIYPQAGRTGILTSAGSTVLLSGSNSTLVNIATITSTTATTAQGAVNCSNSTSSVINHGVIQGGGSGVYLKSGGNIVNFGEISCTKYGIYFNMAGTVANNTGGIIQGGATGVYFFNAGAIDNSGIIIGSGTGASDAGIYASVADVSITNNPGGMIQSGYSGIHLKYGGNVENFGEISGTRYSLYIPTTAASTVLVNGGTFNGSVSLKNGANTVTFAAGSVINGDFAIGTSTDSTLSFIGELDQSLTYSTVTGTFTLGAGKVSVELDVNGIPSGLQNGDEIVLMDASAGKITGTPENGIYSTAGYDLLISVNNNKLVAVVSMPVRYIIAASDINSTISPSGTISVSIGSDQTFTFSANTGYYISSVTVDGVSLSQPQISLGSYTFSDVTSDHTVNVISSAVLIVIVSGPEDQYATVGDMVTFSASGVLEPALDDVPIYQWYISADDGNTWSAISGAAGTSYTYGPVSAADDGKMFRASISISGAEIGLVYTNPAVLHISTGYPYVDETYTEKISPSNTIELTGGTSLSMTDGNWYYAGGTIGYTGAVTVNGNVRIILADSCTLTATITVMDGSSLTVYPQSEKTGMLTSDTYTVTLGNNSTLFNLANITAKGFGAGMYAAVYVQIDAVASIINYGTITGLGYAIEADGILSVSNGTTGIIKSTSSITSVNSHGYIEVNNYADAEIYGVRLWEGGTVNNYGKIYASITATGSPVEVNNYADAEIMGGNAVHLNAGGTVNNYGKITGTNNSIHFDIGLAQVNNYAGAEIKGEECGIYINQFCSNGMVNNSGTIVGANKYGIEITGELTEVNNYAGAEINGKGGVILSAPNDDYNAGIINNYGAIVGTYYDGVSNLSGPFEVNNYAGAEITGTYGITSFTTTQWAVNNYGVIKGTDNWGVWSYRCPVEVNNYAGAEIVGKGGVFATGGAIDNYGMIKGTDNRGVHFRYPAEVNNYAGAEISGTYGIYIELSGMVNNYGTISGTQGITTSGTADIILFNSNVINGNVVLGSYINNVTFVAGSIINGNFDMSKSANGSTLDFIGGLANDLTYSVVNGATSINQSTAVTFGTDWNNGVSAPVTGPDKTIVLIDGSQSQSGKVSPYNSEFKPVDSESFYDIFTRNINGTAANQLIAVAGVKITATADDNSTISPSGVIELHNGVDQMFMFSADAGYEVSYVMVDGVALTQPQTALGSYTFMNVAGDHTIEVKSKIRTFEITVTTDANSTISPSGTIFVQYGADQAFTFSANTGYIISSVIVDGVALTQTQIALGSYTFANVTCNHTIDVSGEPAPAGWEISSVIDTGGSGEDRFNAVVAVSDGVIAVGFSATLNTGDWAGVATKGGQDAIIIKYDNNGGIIWKKNFGGTGADSFNAATAVSDGVIAVGYSASLNSGDWAGVATKGGQDAIIVKYDNNGNVVWKKNFGGNGIDTYNSVTVVPDGIIVAGYSVAIGNGDWVGVATKGGQDAIIVKYDNNGDVIWKKTFGGSGADYFTSVTTVSDGIVVAGYSATFGTGDWAGVATKGGQDAIIVKYDNNGDVIWKKNFGGSGADYFTSVTTVSDGVVVVGYSASLGAGDWANVAVKADQDAIIVKYDNNGNVVWKKTFGGTGNDYFYSVTTVSDGVAAVGYSTVGGTGDLTYVTAKGGYDAVIVRYDDNGSAVWRESFGGTGNDYFYSVTTVSDGVVAAGSSNSSGTGDLTGVAAKGGYDAVLARYSTHSLQDNAEDTLLTIARTGGTGADYFNSVIEVSDGVVAVGYSASFGTGDWSDVTTNGGQDAIVIKYDNSGNVVWKKNFGGSGADSFNSVIEVSDGIIVAGYSGTIGNGDWTGVTTKGGQDAIIVKFDNNGNILWKKNFGGNGTDAYNSVTAVSDGFIAVGHSVTFNNGDWVGVVTKGGQDAIIVKYDNNGDVVWKKNFGGSGGDYFTSVTAVSDGVVVAGYSSVFGAGDWTGVAAKGGYDAIIVKYDNFGNVVWKKTFGGSGTDYFTSVTAVSDGVIAVGYSVTFNSGDWTGIASKGGIDAIIVKYDSNGNIVWKKNFGGAGADYFTSVTTVSNEVVAVGYSAQASFGNGDLMGTPAKGDQDAIIVRYDSDGSVVWKDSFGGTGADSFYSVAAASNGIIAAGITNSSIGDLTGYAAKGGYDAVIVRYGTFIPIADMTGVPSSAVARTPLALTGTASPTDATYRYMIWTVKDAGTTGATINGSILSTTGAGTVVVTVTVPKGTATGMDFTKDFTINVEMIYWTITATADTDSTISPGGSLAVEYGVDQTFTFSAKSGYAICSVTADGITLTPAQIALGSYTFSNITANHTIDVKSAVIAFYITASANSYSSISPSGTIGLYSGASQTFTFSANSTAYYISSVVVDGMALTPAQIALGSYTFSNVTANHTIAVTGAVTIKYFIINIMTDSNSAITPSGTNGQLSVEGGNSQKFTFSAKPGYQITKVLVDGVALTQSQIATGSYTFNNVNMNHNISVESAIFVYVYELVFDEKGNILNLDGSIVKEAKDAKYYKFNSAGDLVFSGGKLIEGKTCTKEIPIYYTDEGSPTYQFGNKYGGKMTYLVVVDGIALSREERDSGKHQFSNLTAVHAVYVFYAPEYGFSGIMDQREVEGGDWLSGPIIRTTIAISHSELSVPGENKDLVNLITTWQQKYALGTITGVEGIALDIILLYITFGYITEFEVALFAVENVGIGQYIFQALYDWLDSNTSRNIWIDCKNADMDHGVILVVERSSMDIFLGKTHTVSITPQ